MPGPAGPPCSQPLPSSSTRYCKTLSCQEMLRLRTQLKRKLSCTLRPYIYIQVHINIYTKTCWCDSHTAGGMQHREADHGMYFGCDQQQVKVRGSARSRSHQAAVNDDTLTSTLTAAHGSSGTRLQHSTMLPGPITARFGCFGPCLQPGDTEGLHSTAAGLGDVQHKGTASLAQQGFEEQGLRFPPAGTRQGFRVSFGGTARSQTPPAAWGAESRNPARAVPPGLSSLQHRPEHDNRCNNTNATRRMRRGKSTSEMQPSHTGHPGDMGGDRPRQRSPRGSGWQALGAGCLPFTWGHRQGRAGAGRRGRDVLGRQRRRCCKAEEGEVRG